MKRCVRLIALLLGSALIISAGGASPCAAENNGSGARWKPGFGYQTKTTYDKLFRDGCGSSWCRDDYCPKRFPCFRLPPILGCCDAYCPKTMPCFSLPCTRGCYDDYCPKPLPSISWPCRWTEFYACPQASKNRSGN